MDPTDVDSARKKVPRGATQMKGLTLMANEGKQLAVNYNSYNQPIDKNSEKLASYVGAKVRQHIPIDIKNWRSVPTNLKENIWIDVKVKYMYYVIVYIFNYSYINVILKYVCLIIENIHIR